MNELFQSGALAVMLCLPLAALAQTGAEPAAGGASAPQLHYRSAFADYRAWRDIKPGDWRALSDSVRVMGSMSSSAAAVSPAFPAASAPSMPGHTGHQMHRGKP